jgi:16S rRNA (uracil1498-N3)-methyltransferase
MKQFFLHHPPETGGQIIVRGDDFHYLKHVRRVKRGECFDGLDAAGNKYRLTVWGEKSDCLILRANVKGKEKISLPPITLIQALPKGRKMDTIVRQATETGVVKIIPIVSRNTIVKIENRDTIAKKVTRWRRIAREAVQQSGVHTLPQIEEPREISWLSHMNEGLKLVFHQKREKNRSLHDCLGTIYGHIILCIGPEGGFTESEVAALKSHGFIQVYLGDSVLRVETAALYAIAAVKVILLERSHWRLMCKKK